MPNLEQLNSFLQYQFLSKSIYQISYEILGHIWEARVTEHIKGYEILIGIGAIKHFLVKHPRYSIKKSEVTNMHIQ